MRLLIHILILNNLLPSSDLLGTMEPDFPAFYEKVVACKGHDQAAIYMEIAEYFKEQADLQDTDSATLLISKKTLRIYNRVIGAIKNPAGEVTFDIRIDVKDEKFRLTIYDPLFRPFVRDRYGKLVTSDDEPESVTDENFRHRQSLFKKIEAQLQTYVNDTGQGIREGIINDELNITNW